METVRELTSKQKVLADAWARFSTRMTDVRASLSKITADIGKRRKKNLLKDAWARFKSKIADIRKRTFGLMIDMDKKRSDKKIEDVRRNLLDI